MWLHFSVNEDVQRLFAARTGMISYSRLGPAKWPIISAIWDRVYFLEIANSGNSVPESIGAHKRKGRKEKDKLMCGFKEDMSSDSVLEMCPSI